MTDDDFRQRILDWAKSEGLDRPKGGGSKLPPRKKPTLSDQLAAVLLLLRNPDGTLLIPEGSRATKAEIRAIPLDWDHIIARGLCGTDTFDNYQPMRPAHHKPKTAKDKASMAHNDRLRKAREEKEIAAAVSRMLAPSVENRSGSERSKSVRGHQKMACGKGSKWKRTMRGRTVLREKRA